MSKISEQFLYELLKSCMTSPKIMSIAMEHLQYEFFPNEEFKKVWRSIQNQYKVNGNNAQVQNAIKSKDKRICFFSYLFYYFNDHIYFYQ